MKCFLKFLNCFCRHGRVTVIESSSSNRRRQVVVIVVKSSSSRCQVVVVKSSWSIRRQCRQVVVKSLTRRPWESFGDPSQPCEMWSVLLLRLRSEPSSHYVSLRLFRFGFDVSLMLHCAFVDHWSAYVATSSSLRRYVVVSNRRYVLVATSLRRGE